MNMLTEQSTECIVELIFAIVIIKEYNSVTDYSLISKLDVVVPRLLFY